MFPYRRHFVFLPSLCLISVSDIYYILHNSFFSWTVDKKTRKPPADRSMMKEPVAGTSKWCLSLH